MKKKKLTMPENSEFTPFDNFHYCVYGPPEMMNGQSEKRRKALEKRFKEQKEQNGDRSEEDE